MYNGEFVLIHVLPLNKCTDVAMTTLQRISAHMSEARHPNVLGFVGMGSDETSMYEPFSSCPKLG